MLVPQIFCNEDYGSKNFVGGNITHQWIIECLEKNDDDFKKYRGDNKIKKIDGYDISDGKGFLSKVFKTSIYFDDEKKEPYIVILKIPGDESIKASMKKQNLENMDELDLDRIASFHNKECLFYNDIAPNIKDLKYPKCYGYKNLIFGQQTGVLIMKFLGADSVTVPFYRSLNIFQVKSILDEAFKLQEYSLINPNKFDNKVWDQAFTSEQMDSFTKYIRSGIPTVKKYVPEEMWSKIEDDVEKLLINYTTIIKYVYFDLSKSNGNEPVISHGDMWINNFMFKVDSNGNCGNILSAVIDWQTVFKGTTGHDISRILSVSTPPDIRREIEKDYLPIFYEKLKDSIIKNEKVMKISYETFLNNYKLCFVEQSMLMILMIGFALQEFNVPEGPDDIWDARKLNIGIRIYYNLVDAIKFCKELRPEWLEINN